TELIRNVATAVERAGGRVVLDLPDEIVMPMKRQTLQRCLSNLLGNAVRYAPSAWITARVEGGTVTVDIDDDGPGIPEEELENVFRLFYRLDASRNRATGGTGLGLAIARDAARAHGGEIELAPSPQGGLRARLRLPL